MEIDRLKLRQYREHRVFSMRELAQKSGVSWNTIHRVETGESEARPGTIRKLAVALEVEPHELLKK